MLGGSVNEAMNSVRGCLNLLKTSVGAFGILAGIAIFLPILIELCLWDFSLGICATVGDLMEQKEIADFLRSISTVIGMLIGLLIFSAIFLVLTCGILMAMRTA